MEPQIKDVLKLDFKERLQMAEALWDSIVEQEADFRISDEHKQVIEDRLEAYKTNKDKMSDWESVRRKIEQKL